jgi:hypothetical protein
MGRNKGFYEIGRWRCSKSHLNITHSMEKVHMLKILLQGIFDEG